MNESKEIYGETQRITQENLPFIYLVNQLSMSAVRNRFEGINSPLLVVHSGTFMK
jgi:ABC-type transport system substrate-binding protein